VYKDTQRLVTTDGGKMVMALVTLDGHTCKLSAQADGVAGLVLTQGNSGEITLNGTVGTRSVQTVPGEVSMELISGRYELRNAVKSSGPSDCVPGPSAVGSPASAVETSPVGTSPVLTSLGIGLS